MRLVFMGTPEFSVPALKALIASDHEICAVYTQPPAKAGRGKALRKSPVHEVAEAAGLTVHTPRTFRDDDVINGLRELEADIAVVVAYGQILPQAALDAPKHGCVNIHASLLPRWRGAAPIHRAIMAGDRETGVAIMVMEAGLDTGPVLMEQRLDIKDDMTTADLHDRLADMGADLVIPAVEFWAAGQIKPMPQSAEGITYARKIDKAEARINWVDGASVVSRLVRGLFPFPGAWCEARGERLKIMAGHPEPVPGEPGHILDSQLLVGCGEDSFRITRLQRAGKAPMDAGEFLRGFDLQKGEQI